MGIRNGCRVVWLMNNLGIDFTSQNFAHPGQKPWQLLTAQLVARSSDGDMSVLADVEMSVLKPPDVRTFGFLGPRLRRWIRNDTTLLRAATHKGAIIAANYVNCVDAINVIEG